MQIARPSTFANPLLRDYVLDSTFDEMFNEDRLVRPHYAQVLETFLNLPPEEVAREKRAVDLSFMTQGITFNVYGHGDGTEKIFPYDLLPRVITGAEWQHIEKGLIQRITALNLFLHDVYHDRKILADNVIPRELVLGNAAYSQMMIGFDPPHGTYVHVCGTDIIRDDTGQFLVLEDNARTPSGVSYVLENRRMMHRAWPELFHGMGTT